MLPLAPGIWGATVAMFLWYFCRRLPFWAYFAVTAALFLIGTVSAEVAEGVFAELDASPIVIDEIFGIFIALALVSARKSHWVAGFLIFLILDGLKPFPASWLDANVHGGLGIMLDDAVAAVYTFILLQLVGYLSSKSKNR